jgi:hypothetical protein
MIVHWQQLTQFYGNELARYRGRFEAAHRATFGLLCCRLAAGDDRLDVSQGEHAEERLLGSSIWTHDIPAALNEWTSLNDTIVATMVLNRSPCRNCAALLASALTNLARHFPARVEANRFLLAARGQYWGQGPQAMTLIPDLRQLSEAGWELAVLQVGNELPDRGDELLANIERATGRRGYVRLASH